MAELGDTFKIKKSISRCEKVGCFISSGRVDLFNVDLVVIKDFKYNYIGSTVKSIDLGITRIVLIERYRNENN